MLIFFGGDYVPPNINIVSLSGSLVNWFLALFSLFCHMLVTLVIRPRKKVLREPQMLFASPVQNGKKPQNVTRFATFLFHFAGIFSVNILIGRNCARQVRTETRRRRCRYLLRAEHCRRKRRIVQFIRSKISRHQRPA